MLLFDFIHHIIFYINDELPLRKQCGGSDEIVSVHLAGIRRANIKRRRTISHFRRFAKMKRGGGEGYRRYRRPIYRTNEWKSDERVKYNENGEQRTSSHL